MELTKRTLAVIVLSFFMELVPQSFGDDKLASPDEILAQAKKGRSEFLLVVQDLERLAPALPSKELLFPYIGILDELKELAQQYGLEELSGGVVKNLGWILTRQGVKWLRLDRDSEDLIRKFMQWSENSSRYQVAGQHLKYLVLVTDKDELLLWHARVALALQFVQELKSEAYVTESFEELQASCTERLIKLKNEILPEQILEVIGSVKSLIAIHSVITFINEEGLRTAQVDELETFLSWTLLLSANLKKLTQVVPFHMLAAPGYLVITLVTKMISQEHPFNVAVVNGVVTALLPSQIPEFGGGLMTLYRDKPIPEKLLPLLVELSSRLLEEYQRIGIATQIEEMKKFLSRVSLLEAGVTQNLEGSYQVTVRDKPGLVNFVHIGNGKFFMALSVRYGGEVSADFSFFYVTYNGKKQQWEAAHYDASDPDFSNPVNEVFFMRFTLEGNGEEKTIKGVLYTSKLTSPFEGKKTASFLKFNDETRESIPEVSGVYLGEDKGVKFRLVIYQSAQRLQGVILVTYPTGIPISVDLEYGYYDPKRNVAYLSSGRFESLRWVHLRGEFLEKGNKFKGQYIQSVYGAIYNLDLHPEEKG